MSKKLASDKERKLYSYIEQRAENVVDEIVDMIKNAPLDSGGMIFVDGPMHSGKSIVACCLEKNLSESKVFACAQPKVDRSDIVEGKIFSRSGLSCKSLSYENKNDIELLFHDHDVIVIDEIQFTQFELQSFLLDAVDGFIERGGWFIAIGLRHTSQQTEFLLSSLLSKRAVRLFKLTSTCQMCGRRGAKFNQRLVKGKVRGKDDQDLLPPSSRVSYESRCKDCLVRH